MHVYHINQLCGIEIPCSSQIVLARLRCSTKMRELTIAVHVGLISSRSHLSSINLNMLSTIEKLMLIRTKHAYYSCGI